MSVLKIGWAEVNITPDKKVALDGQFAERISQYVEKPITITAMAIDSGEDHAIMCSVDLLMMKKQVVAEVRERLADNDLGIDPDKIMFSAIHTHTGPMVANGKTATVKVAASGSGLTYKWYFKNKGDSKFSYTSSFKGSSYSVSMNASRHGRQVYCVVTDKYGNSVRSNTVTLRMG